jgi:hypothetical protein
MNTVERNPLFGIKPRKLRTTRTGTGTSAVIGHTSGEMTNLIPGQRLSFWLGQAAQARREDAGIRLEAIAAEIGVGKETLDRFEKGRTLPHDLEAVLVGYAKLTELDDPREIAVQAVRLWYEANAAASA